jgi:hypothetical protein
MNTKIDEMIVATYLSKLSSQERLKVEERFERFKELVYRYCVRARRMPITDVKMCSVGAAWDGSTMLIGVKMLHRHTWQGLQLIAGHEVGHALSQYGRGREVIDGKMSAWDTIDSEYFADCVSLDLCKSLTVYDWAKGMIGALKIDGVSAADLDCGGDLLDIRYDKLLADAARGHVKMGKALDFRSELKLNLQGYSRLNGLPPID